jgi:hypothetical protein
MWICGFVGTKKNPPQLNEVGFDTNYFDTKTKLVQILFFLQMLCDYKHLN